LLKELRTFSVKLTSNLNEQHESWREGDHHDLVLGVAVAAFAAEGLPHPALPSDAAGPAARYVTG
jgi:hypothetical protein